MSPSSRTTALTGPAAADSARPRLSLRDLSMTRARTQRPASVERNLGPDLVGCGCHTGHGRRRQRAPS
eukprot:6866895-Alexandrium_andersonii.AAC.1